jgi:hypothetical protein
MRTWKQITFLPNKWIKSLMKQIRSFQVKNAMVNTWTCISITWCFATLKSWDCLIWLNLTITWAGCKISISFSLCLCIWSNQANTKLTYMNLKITSLMFSKESSHLKTSKRKSLTKSKKCLKVNGTNGAYSAGRQPSAEFTEITQSKKESSTIHYTALLATKLSWTKVFFTTIRRENATLKQLMLLVK